MILVVSLSPSWQRTLVFPKFSPGEVNRATDVIETASGKGVNVARVATQLGAKVRLLTTAGGPRGTLFRKALKIDGVPATIISTAGETRLCQTLIGLANTPHLNPLPQGERKYEVTLHPLPLRERAGVRGSVPIITELVEPPATLNPAEVDAVLSAYSRALRKASLVVLIGSIPKGCGNGFYAKLTRQANRLHIPVLVDAQRELLIQGIREHPSLVKINRAELAEATGTTNLAGGVKQLTKWGAKQIVITQGSKPAIAFDGKGSWKIIPPKIDVVNSTGCGDAMMAGIATGLHQGKSLENALKLGVACGAANAMTVKSGDLRLRDVRKLSLP
ncbi:MAG: 1-phosphofructokinase family hexose kinase [bacterium]